MIHLSNANIKKVSCEVLSQISFMKRKELDKGSSLSAESLITFLTSLLYLPRIFPLNLACISSSMCSRTYLHPSSSRSFPHKYPEANILCFFIHTSPSTLARSQILPFATAATLGKASCEILGKFKKKIKGEMS